MNKFLPPGKTKTVKGTILSPELGGLRFILSINNLAGKAENPLFPVFDKKWRKVKEDSRGWYVNRTGEYKLGAINVTACQSDVWVIHLLCQDKDLKTDLKGLEECFKKLYKNAKYENASVHISNMLVDMIPEIKDLSTKYLIQEGVSVYFYEEK
jgi:hypothetical protein